MSQQAIPFLFMRGGTSRGPFFNRADLPEDLDELADVLIKAVGSGHPLNIDGIGGGAAVTTKVAMLSPSSDEWADIDYFFAQVSVEDRLVDYKPTCGNMLTAVGPAAIEMGLVKPDDDTTEIRIRAVNTGAEVISVVQTPDREVEYQGDAAIDGVPGTAAPIRLNFRNVAGGATGKLLPTGNLRDAFDGIEVTCMDVAMPVVMARADAFGLTGHESREDLDSKTDFFAQMESVRLKAGAAMGMGDVSKSVTPKFAVLAPARAGRIDCRTLLHALANASLTGGDRSTVHIGVCPGTRVRCRRIVGSSEREPRRSEPRASGGRHRSRNGYR